MAFAFTPASCSSSRLDSAWLAAELSKLHMQQYYSMTLRAASTGNSEDYVQTDSIKVPVASTLVAVDAICTAITSDPQVTIYDENLATAATMLDADIDLAADTRVEGTLASGADVTRAAGDVISLRSKNDVGDDATNVQVTLTFQCNMTDKSGNDLETMATRWSHHSTHNPPSAWLQSTLDNIDAAMDSPLSYVVLRGGHSDMDPGTGNTDTSYDNVVAPANGTVTAIYAVANAVTNDLEVNVKDGSANDLCSSNMKFATANTFLTGTLNTDYTGVSAGDVLTIYAKAPGDDEEAQNVSVFVVMTTNAVTSAGAALTAYAAATLGSGENIEDVWTDEETDLGTALNDATNIVVMEMGKESVGAGVANTTIQDECVVPKACTITGVYFVANAKAGGANPTADLFDEELSTAATMLDAAKTIAAADTAYSGTLASGADTARDAGDVLSLRVTTNVGDGSLTNIRAFVVGIANILNSTD